LTLLAIAGASWVVTAVRMQGMDTGPATDLGALGWFVSVWATMMAAMMLPSFAPAAVSGRPRSGGARAVVAESLLLAGGYLLTWTALGVIVYLLAQVTRPLPPGWLAWHQGGRDIAGVVLAGAAFYELTTWKRAGLRRCRTPWIRLGSAATLAPLVAGVEEACWCVGCSWALMAALFALGEMSVPWMAVVAAMIAAEKLLPWENATRFGVATVLVGLAARALVL
jgi:predicted metal-binding membrane protein